MNYLKTLALAGAAALGIAGAASAQDSPGPNWVSLGHYGGASGWALPVPVVNGHHNAMVRFVPDVPGRFAALEAVQEVDCENETLRVRFTVTYSDRAAKHVLSQSYKIGPWSSAEPGSPGEAVIALACGDD